eukprot:4938030-Amphidinium_carterae.1
MPNFSKGSLALRATSATIWRAATACEGLCNRALALTVVGMVLWRAPDVLEDLCCGGMCVSTRGRPKTHLLKCLCSRVSRDWAWVLCFANADTSGGVVRDL